jgi:hypothetical protein
MLLGISVAVITAASLHLTVGERFHQRMSRHYGKSSCAHQWKQRSDNHERHHAKPEDFPDKDSQKF